MLAFASAVGLVGWADSFPVVWGNSLSDLYIRMAKFARGVDRMICCGGVLILLGARGKERQIVRGALSNCYPVTKVLWSEAELMLLSWRWCYLSRLKKIWLVSG